MTKRNVAHKFADEYDLLINPTFAREKSWNIIAISDRPSVDELSKLLEHGAGSLSGVYIASRKLKIVDVTRDPKFLAQFFLEYSGGNVAVCDDCDTFIMSVIMGDLTLLACNEVTAKSIFGYHSMSREIIDEVFVDVRPSLAEQIIKLYAWPN